jgi:hypothetical protein
MGKLKALKLELDYETADKITVCLLKDHRKILKAELKHFKEGTSYVHPEDAANNIKLIAAMDLILKYFGEE